MANFMSKTLVLKEFLKGILSIVGVSECIDGKYASLHSEADSPKKHI